MNEQSPQKSHNKTTNISRSNSGEPLAEQIYLPHVRKNTDSDNARSLELPRKQYSVLGESVIGSGIILSSFNLIGGGIIGCIGGHYLDLSIKIPNQLGTILMILNLLITPAFSIFICSRAMDQKRPGWLSKYWPLLLIAFAIPAMLGPYTIQGLIPKIGL